MIKLTSKKDCCGCGACSLSCPRRCIQMEKDAEGFLYPKVNYDLCVNCGKCVSVCPFRAQGATRNVEKDVFCLKNKDERIRFNSSSGGVFFELAKEIIRDGGVVCGATYADDFKSVKHVVINHISEIGSLMKSKYSQSDLNDCFVLIKDELIKGKSVLFSGTPCQVAALKLFLGEVNVQKLYLVEVICHGVPSQKLWEKYINNITPKGMFVTSVNMRYKKASFGVADENVASSSLSYHKTFNDDIYLRLFNSDLALRKSCYNCVIKKQESYADLTIGDFWGVSELLPRFFDGKGISLCVVNTKKGGLLLERVVESFEYEAVRYNAVFHKYNKSICTSPSEPIKRDLFYENLKKSFRHLEFKFLYPGLKGKIKYCLRGLLTHNSKNTELNYGVLITFERKNHENTSNRG